MSDSDPETIKFYSRFRMASNKLVAFDDDDMMMMVITYFATKWDGNISTDWGLHIH